MGKFIGGLITGIGIGIGMILGGRLIDRINTNRYFKKMEEK